MQAAALVPQPFGRRAQRRPMLQSLRGQQSRKQNPVSVVGGSGTVIGASPTSTTVQFSPSQNQNWWWPYWGSWGWGWGAPYSQVYWGWPSYSWGWPSYYDAWWNWPYAYGWGWGW